MNTTSVILTSILTCAFGLGGALQAAQHQAPSSPTSTYQGAGRYVQVEYPPSTAANELQVGVTYVLWIPGGAPRLRGVIVHQHGAGAQARQGRSHRRLRPALAGAGQEVGLRSAGPLLPRAERENGHLPGRLGTLVRPAPGLGQDPSSRPSRSWRSKSGHPSCRPSRGSSGDTRAAASGPM